MVSESNDSGVKSNNEQRLWCYRINYPGRKRGDEYAQQSGFSG
jgi:hypothetical protein